MRFLYDNCSLVIRDKFLDGWVLIKILIFGVNFSFSWLGIGVKYKKWFDNGGDFGCLCYLVD